MTPSKGPATVPTSMTIDLFAPGMTTLHRVGVAGLAMTLPVLETDQAAARLRALGRWEISDRSVTLHWQGDGQDFFKELFAQSFRLTDRGLIWFPALGDPLGQIGEAVVLHNALLNTFLQHPKSRGSKGRPVDSVVVEVNDEPFVVRFQPLTRYMHQRAGVRPGQSFEVAGWLYPGGIVRHVQAGTNTALRGSRRHATALSEEPARALALLYATVGAVYFQVHRRQEGVRPEFCLVLPDVTDLLAYADLRRAFLRQGIARLQVAGVAEAAARVLIALEVHGMLRAGAGARCEVVGFGTVPWSNQQKTRVRRFGVSATGGRDLRAYRLATNALPPRLATGAPDPKTGAARHWWVVPQVPDLVAENIVQGQPWWRGFAAMWQRVRDTADRRRRDLALVDERRGLQQMVNDGRTMPDGPEARLVRACQEAWRRRLGALGERARSQGTPFDRLAAREYERVRISFARCKNAAMLRQTLTDFWARAGSLPELQESWPEVLPLLGDRWRDGRDLALLALASYKPRDRDEAEALAATEVEGETE